jgi:putative ABC transport system ATP-binding protein
LWRTFKVGGEEVHALHDLSLEFPSGELALIRGRSGSGKTTLLNLIAGLDEPSRGSIEIGGRALGGMTPGEKIEMRRHSIGFIFQTFGLLPYLSVEENVEIPMRMVHASRKQRQERVADALRLVGLSGRARHRTYELSGGEQQRVSIARALVNQPSLILADEPTGQLDSATGAAIIQLLRDIVDETGVTVLVASHDANVVQVADVVYELRDGTFVDAL